MMKDEGKTLPESGMQKAIAVSLWRKCSPIRCPVRILFMRFMSFMVEVPFPGCSGVRR